MLYGAVFFAGFFTFYSCSAIEILPGLCYTDKDGTYLCPSDPIEVCEDPIGTFSCGALA